MNEPAGAAATDQSVLLSGATGLVGSRLRILLEKEGLLVRGLSRKAGDVQWDGTTPPAAALRGAHSLIHLSGQPVFGGVPGSRQRERILSSRVDSTRAFVDALAALPAEERPEVFLCASAIGYYGDRGEDLLTEDAGPGSGFLADVCRAWEAEATRAESLGIRTVRLRIGVVMAREGGALPMMALPFRAGLGGPLGDGRQWFSWIHVDDLCQLIAAARRNPAYTGAINAVAPNPVRNADLTRSLAKCVGRWAPFRVPKFALRALLGPLASELLGSRHVVPARAQELGFEHRFPEIAGALAEELGE